MIYFINYNYVKYQRIKYKYFNLITYENTYRRPKTCINLY